jgi:peptidoglycan hydrolase-like protein with peptidoglycan-binding domain
VKAFAAGLVGVLLGAIVAGATAWVALRPAAAVATEQPDRAAVERGTAAVERQTLESTDELDATLGYAGDGTLLAGLAGTATRLPDEGAILDQGDVIAEVDGARRSVLLYGSRPAWRPMTRGTSGNDVAQLEKALDVLGYLPKGVRPDRDYGAATVKAVKRWQRDLGVKRDGVVDLGEVVFAEGPVRIASLEVELGARVAPGSRLATTTSGTRVVSLALDADRQDIVGVGDAVSVELPDGTVTPGRVAEVATVAEADPNGGDPTVEVTITLDDPAATGALDGAPATVSVTRETRPDVLTVPVDALLALKEGGYAVEVVEGDGDTRLTGVDLGMFADGRVQVTGGVSDGDQVVVPR